MPKINIKKPLMISRPEIKNKMKESEGDLTAIRRKKVNKYTKQ
jgi:hypothetical protein